MTLEASGYAVATAADGAEGLRRLRQEPPPDLILLDLMLPVVSGWEFRRQQQQDPTLAAIPVVVVSAVGDLEQKAADIGAAELLQKPVDFGQLLTTVRRFVTPQRSGVLVVDDEAMIRTLLELTFRRDGFMVWAAGNGREAIEIYRRHRESIGVVLLDVQMPEFDGPQTLGALQAVDPQVRALFMSGDTGSYDAETLRALGASGVFAKPFNLVELTQAIRQIVAKAPPV